MLVLLHLFALFLLILLGFYVFVADPRSRAHQTFAAFIAFLALWTTKDLVFWNFPETQRYVGGWASASFVIALAMQCSLVVFGWVFPENGRTPRKKAAVLFAPSLVLVPAAFGGLLWRSIAVNDSQLSIELTPLAYAFVAYVYFLFFYGAVLLFGKYGKYKGTQKGQQVGAILWGLAITGVLKTLANIALPYFGVNSLLPFSAIFVLPGVVVYAYAVSNFRLFSLQTALNQFRLFPITYKVALSIACVAILSFLMFQVPIVLWSFADGMSFEAWRKYLVFSVITALLPNLFLLLLVVRIVSRPLQRITLAAVQVTEGGYGTEVDLRHSNDEIGLLAESFNEMSRKMAADIESLREMNDQLTRTEKLAAMGTLAAGVAHEVNNPLASISSLIQMMRSQRDLSEDIKEKLELIASQIDRISQVTRDLTNFSRTRPAAKGPADMNDVIETSLRLAGFDPRFQALEVEKNLSADLPRIYADTGQLQQVVLNMLLNARDAMPGGGRLTISTFSRNGALAVEIADSGPGLDGERMKHAFDPFFTTKPTGQGTGLGLAVCYGIVTAHGGTIEIGRSNGSGAKFTILLPVGDSPVTG